MLKIGHLQIDQAIDTADLTEFQRKSLENTFIVVSELVRYFLIYRFFIKKFYFKKLIQHSAKIEPIEAQNNEETLLSQVEVPNTSLIIFDLNKNFELNIIFDNYF